MFPRRRTRLGVPPPASFAPPPPGGPARPPAPPYPPQRVPVDPAIALVQDRPQRRTAAPVPRDVAQHVVPPVALAAGPADPLHADPVEHLLQLADHVGGDRVVPAAGRGGPSPPV